MNLLAGDLITAVRRFTTGWRVEHGSVTENARSMVFVYAPVGRPETGIVAFSRDEGIRWIRGHHTEDSPEVRAMTLANALRETAEPFVCVECGHYNTQHDPFSIIQVGPCRVIGCTCPGY